MDNTLHAPRRREGAAMLVFSNRKLGAGPSFSAAFTPGGDALALADATPSQGTWRLGDPRAGVDDPDAITRLAPLFGGAKPVMLYVHGYNNTPESCFERLAALQKLYAGVEVIGFSWPSEGLLADGSALPGMQLHDAGDENELEGIEPSNRTSDDVQGILRRYRQAKTNAQDSIDAFARLLHLVAVARLQVDGQPFSLAIHSLGAHLFQYALPVEGVPESAGAACNVSLLAPCVRAAGHAQWITRFVPQGRTYVTYNQGDSVLFGAYVADGEQFKLGTDPGADIVRSGGIRYISFTNAPVDFGGHGYFVNGVAARAKKLFARIFASQADFAGAQTPGSGYPFGCEPDGSVCYMAVPGQPEPGG